MNDRERKGPGRELFGRERSLAIAAFLEWYEARDVRECIANNDDYPLAQWTRAHNAELAKRRTERNGYYRNTKPRSRGRR